MGLYSNAGLAEQAKIVTGLAPTTPSSSTPDYVSLKNAERCTILICCDNATTVTGSDITLHQATAVAGTGEKALGFDWVFANIDTAASDAFTKTAVVSDTFTTTAVDAKNSLYAIEIKAEHLDVANDFDCLRAGTGDATATVLSVVYILWPLRHGVGVSAITD